MDQASLNSDTTCTSRLDNLTRSNDQAERVAGNTAEDAASLVQSSNRLVQVVSEFKLA